MASDAGHISSNVTRGTVDPVGAARARSEATSHFVEAVELGVDVREVAARLKTLREANHFAELIEESMKRRIKK